MPRVKTETDHQSKASRSGNAFQREIYKMILDQVKDPNLSVNQPSTTIVKAGKKKRKGKQFPCLLIHTPIASFIGDTDIVVFNKRKQVPAVIISCKTSIRERIAQALYSARLYRAQHGENLPFYLVTRDPGLEFGSEQKPKKALVMVWHERISVYTMNPRTVTGGPIRPIDQLIPDIHLVTG